MASIGFLIGGALVNALAFSGSNFLFSSLSKESIHKERKRHDKAIEDQIEWAFSGSNFLFSSLSKESIDKERKRHDKAIEDQIEWAKKIQERLDYINNQIIKEHKTEKRFTDLISVMQQCFLVTGMHLEPLLPKPTLSDFYVPSEDHHNRELAFITLSMTGIGAFLWYSDR